MSVHHDHIKYDRLEREFRSLYWELNELQVIGAVTTGDAEYDRIESRMYAITQELGYTPES